jgi:alkyl sulfatase BDS1-like metallo-beta-lactamase superfamily hydrolase
MPKMLAAMVQVDRVCRKWLEEAWAAGTAGDLAKKARLYGAVWAVASGNRRANGLSAHCLEEVRADDDAAAWEQFLLGAAWGSLGQPGAAWGAFGKSDKY